MYPQQIQFHTHTGRERHRFLISVLGQIVDEIELGEVHGLQVLKGGEVLEGCV